MKKIKGIKNLSKKDLFKISGGGNGANLLGFIAAEALASYLGPLGLAYVNYAYFAD